MKFKNIYKKYIGIKHENNIQKCFMLNLMQSAQGLVKILEVFKNKSCREMIPSN